MLILIKVPTSESLWRLDRCGHDVDYHARQGYVCAMARLITSQNDTAPKPDTTLNRVSHASQCIHSSVHCAKREAQEPRARGS